MGERADFELEDGDNLFDYPSSDVPTSGTAVPALFHRDGHTSMTGDLNMGSQDISSVGTVDGRDVSVDGTKLDGITTGTWTPVLTGIVNVDSTSNVEVFTWIRIGTNLMAWGQFDVDHTSSGTLTTVDLSLPSSGVTIPAFTAAENIFGHGSGDGMGIRGGFVQAKPVSRLARYSFRGVGSASNTHILSFLVKGVS